MPHRLGDRINKKGKYLVVDRRGKIIESFRLKMSAKYFAKNYNYVNRGLGVKAKIVVT